MSNTRRCQLALLTFPILVPALVGMAIIEALVDAALAFGKTLSAIVVDDYRTLYRRIYRPARYGHVLDPPKR